MGTELPRLVRAGRAGLRPHRVVAAEGRTVGLADGSALPVSCVLWCTGSRPDTRWLDVAGALDEGGAPRHDRGASPVAGLHWVGLPWQTRLDSSIVHGAGPDARAVAARVRRQASGRAGRQDAPA